ncbi:MAG: SLC13/DASS family transporter [Sphingomonadales bacterium]|nr:SLC13/DASS family transporter [Sphingomonadales bacterium]
MPSPALTSALILGAALIMFVSERVRHDLVAALALLACLVTGLVPLRDALTGFSDPAVIAVASVLVVGRALELSGIANVVTARFMPPNANFQVRMGLLLAAGAVLSAFMNNIAALVVTMPIAAEIVRSNNKAPGAILMPLAFATILGGMTTLIGTPANLIISSMRDRELGEPFGFFDMTAVGALVAGIGLVYITTVGWRLLPASKPAARAAPQPWMTFELPMAAPFSGEQSELSARLRAVGARMIGIVRFGHLRNWPEGGLRMGDRLLLMSRSEPRIVAASFEGCVPPDMPGASEVFARVSVAHGSPLIGRGYSALAIETDNAVRLVAAGPRAAKQRLPMALMEIDAGDQLFLEGESNAVARAVSRLRLLEIDRFDRLATHGGKAYAIGAIFIAAIIAIVMTGLSPAIAFFAAATLIAAFRLVPADQVYMAIDWSIIVLLAAMIPVGASFENSGGASYFASWLSETLHGQPLAVAIGAICTVTMLLSIFLNNVATAVIMAPMAVRVADMMGLPPDAMLLAVLIGASSDFLTPIGHQNNLLVMGPGGYRFSDYSRMGAPLAIMVVLSTSLFLAWRFG